MVLQNCRGFLFLFLFFNRVSTYDVHFWWLWYLSFVNFWYRQRLNPDILFKRSLDLLSGKKNKHGWACKRPNPFDNEMKKKRVLISITTIYGASSIWISQFWCLKYPHHTHLQVFNLRGYIYKLKLLYFKTHKLTYTLPISLILLQIENI